jgi:hypothetical protein
VGRSGSRGDGGRDRSRDRRGSDPIREATRGRAAGNSRPTATAALRTATRGSAPSGRSQGDLRIPSRSEIGGSRGRVPSSRVVAVPPAREPARPVAPVRQPPTSAPSGRQPPRRKPLHRKPTVPGKQRLERGSRKRVPISWEETPKAKPKRGDAKRQGAKPPKSAPSSPRTRDKVKTPAARSSPKGARQAKKSGSAKLTDKNYKGYDATAGKPGKKERPTCKDRPSDNRSGGGGSRKFIPWC